VDAADQAKNGLYDPIDDALVERHRVIIPNESA